ncbi:hypothetical protein KSP35_05410 [Aquihabitans sp. G128]|uniref:hypothetical protein n=1 Tax=Aquihabitans sp. G128 TaxID=2849779 RepID=UPI001C226F6B|nr:hypothetical protein [Aquihabitans sp. G128]QXC62246.1 hypothetical protein KSP35_05410 [Aquihabitans sp. G128]
MANTTNDRIDGEATVVVDADALPVHDPAFGYLELPRTLSWWRRRRRSISYPSVGDVVNLRVDVRTAGTGRLTDLDGTLIQTVPLVRGSNVVQIRRPDARRDEAVPRRTPS